MIYKIGLLGASGRMGSEIAAKIGQGYFLEQDCLELCEVVVNQSKLTSIEGVKTRRLGEPPREPVHLWIDFSQPQATVQLLEWIDTPLLIGTTGFDEKQLRLLEAYATTHPVLLASNTSEGMNLFLEVLRRLPLSPSPRFDVTLSESHHRAKKDRPSGSAKTLLSVLQQKGFENLEVAVTRAGGIRGEHVVRFAFADEIFELRHEALDRRVFAEGALMGALYLLKQNSPGLYSMRDVYFPKETR